MDPNYLRFYKGSADAVDRCRAAHIMNDYRCAMASTVCVRARLAAEVLSLVFGVAVADSRGTLSAQGAAAQPPERFARTRGPRATPGRAETGAAGERRTAGASVPGQHLRCNAVLLSLKPWRTLWMNL